VVEIFGSVLHVVCDARSIENNVLYLRRCNINFGRLLTNLTALMSTARPSPRDQSRLGSWNQEKEKRGGKWLVQLAE
jgi:hypothetical protein